VLATVMSLVIALFGGISLLRLTNRELPSIDPPIVSVTTVFPGAAPEVVETSVTDVLEDQVNGIEGVKVVTSLSREQVSQITVEFELGRDLEAAANDVRDRVARARNQLPEEIDEPVVAKRDSDAQAVMWLALSGEQYDQVQLTTIAEKLLIDRLAKLAGVANVIIGGERRYSMRVWVENRRLASQYATIADIAAALQRENVDIPSGRLESRDAEFTVRSLGELRSVSDFENMIIANVNGQAVKLGDIARIEVGPQDVRKQVRVDGRPAIGLGIVKQSKANTLDVADAVRAEALLLEPLLPPGVKLEIAFDSSTFIRASIHDVSLTIFEASLLVVLVIYVFLRSFRATLIPAVAIPISILGAFGVLYVFDFTVNTLTLMGVTLAIGLVVDDAIVVLENVTRWAEEGASPLEAARRGMAEIAFAVVAATVSAVAVFLPLTFLTDETGRLFREFAVTVAAALAVSGFVALTLSPALCALVVRPHLAEHGLKAVFARFFDRIAAGYDRGLAGVLRRPGVWVAIGGGWVVLGAMLLPTVKQELIPKSDRSTMLVFTRAPEGSTIDYMDRYQAEAERRVRALPEVQRVFSVIALGIGTPGLVNQGVLIASLSDPDQRGRSQHQVVNDVRRLLAEVPGITAFPTSPSMISGFGASPVQFVIEGDDLAVLAGWGDEIERRISSQDGFGNVQTNLFLNKPQLEVSIDRDRASDLGVSVRSIASALQILLGGLDLSTFKLEGETYDVMVQLEQQGRDDPRDLLELYVRGNHDELIPLSSVIDTRETIAPREIPHYDRQRSVMISADLATLTQGEGLEIAASIANQVLPDGTRIRFVGEAEKFFASSNALLFAYGLAIVVVYLVLAAQFESFVHPVTILVAVALSFTGALVALLATQTTLNLFSKIGLVMLVGLVTKNSILIVEFANQLRDRGLPLVEAVKQASRTRFRPILMTALATMVGILPIALGRGAGGDSRAPLGIAVLGGMLFSTVLTFLIVPATYVLIASARERVGGRVHEPHRKPIPPAAIAGS
jgi:multidrug efflux pump